MFELIQLKIFESNKLNSFEYKNWEVYSNGKREVSTKIDEIIWIEWMYLNWYLNWLNLFESILELIEFIWIDWIYLKSNDFWRRKKRYVEARWASLALKKKTKTLLQLKDIHAFVFCSVSKSWQCKSSRLEIRLDHHFLLSSISSKLRASQPPTMLNSRVGVALK